VRATSPPRAYLAAQHKAHSIRLRAVTVENNGAGAAGLAGTQARCLLDHFGLRDVPVAQGPSGLPVWPSLTAGTAAIMATLIGPCARLSAPGDPDAGAALLARVAREERDLRVFATGPMTNLARALAREPSLRRAELVNVNGGDIGAKPDPLLDEGLLRDGTQDFNFSCDPAAARAVVAAGLRSLLLVSASATDDVPLSPQYAARLTRAARTTEARFVARIANHVVVVAGQQATGASYWWDPLTVATAERPDLITEYRADPLTVRVDGRAGGRTEVGGSGAPVRYAVRADRQRFEDHFLAVLNGQGCPVCRASAKRLRHAIAARWPDKRALGPVDGRP
jgi:purine nucleosidase